MQQLRLAVLSATGTAQKRLIPAVLARNLCSVIAVHGRNPEKLVALSKERAIPAYFVDAERMLEETKPDFVFIGSPPALHAEQIEICIERNIPVLCEKPLCLGSGGAERIRTLVGARKSIVRVAHHLRHQPGVALLREWIAKDLYGKLRRVSMQWGFWLNATAANALWKLDPSRGGPNCFYDAGVHALDLMLHLLPRAVKVSSLAQRSRFRETVDNVSALVLCSDVLVELAASQSMHFPVNGLTLDFETGTVSIPQAFSEKPFAKMEVSSASGIRVLDFEPCDLYGNEVEDFIGLLNGKSSVGTTVEEACCSIGLLEAITESYTTGQTLILQ